MRVLNTYDQLVAARGGVAICPAIGATSSRAEKQPYTAWTIMRVVDGQIVETDKDAAWYWHGKKAFGFFHFEPPNSKPRAQKGKSLALQAAQAWCSKTYGESGPWQRNAMGDYVPKRINIAHPIRRPE